MVDTIETFVAKLQEEGVQAGQAAAEKLQTQARQQADSLIADAKKQAEQILSDAQAEAKSILDRGKTDLALASRDTVARLREALSQALSAVLSEGAKSTLTDLDFLGRTLHDIVLLYAKADLDRKLHVDINVPCEIRDQLKEWAFRELGKDAVAEVRPSFDLKGHLQQVGFEYSAGSGGTVEITLESVVDMLSGLVTPALRDVLQKESEESKSAT
jgi:hypothetical protein